MSLETEPRRHQDALLERHLHHFLGDVDAAALSLLREHLEWVQVAGGEVLMRQDEPGDSMYLSISGRLRAYVRGADGSERMVREMGRGHVIGEMSLYTDAPRSATVVAIRDSVLVRLAKSEFRNLLASSAQMSIALTRQIIKRLQGPQSRSEMEPPVTMALLPISAGVELAGFAERLAAQLARIGPARVIDAPALDAALGEPGAANRAGAELDGRIARWLDEVEASVDFVLLVGDAGPSVWTRRCGRHADERLLIADANAEPALHPIETECLMDERPSRRPGGLSGASEAAEILVLLHPAEARSPRGTRRWLARRPVADHVHIRPTLERDMARLARLQSRTAVGLVLAGGGARGLAHLGVWRALRERGIEIDVVGGTSIGAVMSAYVASDQAHERVMANARRAFGGNPTGDFNWLPLLSLIKGRRLKVAMDAAALDLFGAPIDIEDLWKNCYFISTNYSKASEQLLRTGPLVKAIVASISIPGALPPVIHDGDLLCDGGTFNNFPVDVMRGMRGVGKVIGVDLQNRKARRIEHEEMPGSWAVLRDRLRPYPKRRYRLPGMASFLMNVSILYSTSRQAEARKLTDVYFNPPLERVGMLAWNKLDQIVRQGHAHAEQVLGELPAGELERLASQHGVAG